MSLGCDDVCQCFQEPPLFIKFLLRRSGNKSAKFYGVVPLSVSSQSESASISPFESLMPFLPLFLSHSALCLCPLFEHFSFGLSICVSTAVRADLMIKTGHNAKRCGGGGGVQVETGEVRGEARQGQAAVSGVHSSYFPLFILFQFPLYYFSEQSTFAAV